MRSASSWARSTRRVGLLVDALGLADLLGHGDAQLVDEVEGATWSTTTELVMGMRRPLLDEGLEPFDEEDDVDGEDSRGAADDSIS